MENHGNLEGRTTRSLVSPTVISFHLDTCVHHTHTLSHTFVIPAVLSHISTMSGDVFTGPTSVLKTQKPKRQRTEDESAKNSLSLSCRERKTVNTDKVRSSSVSLHDKIIIMWIVKVVRLDFTLMCVRSHSS